MNWRVKQSLKLYKKLYIHLLQKNIFGTSIMFVPWVTRYRSTKRNVTVMVPQQVTDPASGMQVIIPVQQVQEQDLEVVDYDGPDIFIENLEDWIVPAGSTDIANGPFIRRLHLSIDELLDMRDEGKLDEAVIQDKLDDLRRLAESGSSAKDDQMSDEKQTQTGIPARPQGKLDKLIILNWFGRFRMNVNEDGSGGDERPHDVVAFYQPDKKLTLGVCRLVDIFPDGRNHFIVSQGLMDVNCPWGIGLPEQIEPISREMDALHNLSVKAGEGAIGPVIFYEPGAGYDPEKHKLEPFTAIPTANAATVKAVNLGQINLGPYVLLMRELMGFAERLTSLTDAQLGRQFDRPNAPRTLGQQQLLQGESNTNLLLDMRLERENLRELLNLIWEMDKRFLPKPTFFRVTESDPGDVMTEEDMQGNYDFDIGPVTAISNRANKMAELMQMLALAMQMNIPPVVLALFKKALQKNGQADIAAILPAIEEMVPPDSAQHENVKLLQGEDPPVHPMDNHVQHIAVHEDLKRRIQETDLGEGITAEAMNPQAVGRIDAHVAQHQQALKSGAMSLLSGKMAPMNGGGGNQMGQQVPNQGSPMDGQRADLASILNVGNLNIA